MPAGKPPTPPPGGGDEDLYPFNEMEEISDIEVQRRMKTDKEIERRMKGIGNVNAAMAKMQRDVEGRIEEIKGIGTREGVAQVSSAVNRVLLQLGKTIEAVAVGAKKITITTALATKDAISQYGKAISEDISFNKQNIVAMALSRATPLFGYFASKFMETDVFKSAAQKIKTVFGDAISSLGNKFRSLFSTGWERVKGVFGKGKRAEAETVPKLQAGGVVGRGGMAEIHKAEVVMPMSSLMKKIDELKEPSERAIETVQKPISMFNQLLSTISKRQAAIEEYTLRRAPEETRSALRTFISAYAETFTEHQLPWQEQMVRLQRRLVFGLIGLGRRVRIAFSTMLYEHPLLRNFFWTMGVITKAFTFPLRFLFRKRGGYQADLPRVSNPLDRLVQTAGLIYTGMMYQFDKVIAYTKDTSSVLRDMSRALTGKEYGTVEEKTRKRWTIPGKTLRAMAAPLEWALKMKEGPESADFWTKKRSVWGMIKAPFEAFIKEQAPKIKIMPPTLLNKVEKIVDAILERLEPYDEAREKTVTLLASQYEVITEQKAIQKKGLGISEKMKEAMGRFGKRLKGLGSSILKWIMLGLGLLKDMFMNLLGKGGGLLRMLGGGAARLLGGRGLGSLIGAGLGGLRRLGGRALGRVGGRAALGTAGRTAAGWLTKLIAPLTAVAGTAYGAVKAKKEWGLPGEEMGWGERIGLGAAKPLKWMTFGLLDPEAQSKEARDQARAAHARLVDSQKSLFDKIREKSSEAAWAYMSASPEDVADKFRIARQTGAIVYDHGFKKWITMSEPMSIEEKGRRAAAAGKKKAEEMVEGAKTAAMTTVPAAVEAAKMKAVQTAMVAGVYDPKVQKTIEEGAQKLANLKEKAKLGKQDLETELWMHRFIYQTYGKEAYMNFISAAAKNKGAEISERATGVIAGQMDLARGAAAEFLMQTEPMLAAGKEAIKGVQAYGQQAVSNVVTTVNNTLSSNSQTVSSQPTNQQSGDYDKYVDISTRGE